MYKQIEQLSEEWWAIKVGKVSGTRWGQLTSGIKNSLVEELANELLDDYVERSDYISDDMQFGIDNEPIAIDKYEAMTGIKFDRGGVLISDINPDIHMASPDGYNREKGIVVEVKCTKSGKKQLTRFKNGIDSDLLPQVINYFATESNVREVHWISYCPFRPEREIVPIIFTRDTVVSSKETKKHGLVEVTIQDEVDAGLSLLPKLREDVKNLIAEFKVLEF